MMPACLLAQQVLAYARLADLPITNFRLQKILYYLLGYAYRLYRVKLFDTPLLCWTYGPVVPEVYFQYSTWGAEPIQIAPERIPDPDQRIAPLIQILTNRLLTTSSQAIVDQVTRELPCAQTRPNQVIDQDLLFRFFAYYDPLALNLNDNKA